MNNKEKLRNVLFILLGVAGLLLKQQYNGMHSELVKSYLGNISVSFAMYFLVSIYATRWKNGKVISAVVALAIVELFEITNGFGVMLNTFDVFDLVANIVGVGLAITIDFSIKLKL
ncbi:MAG: hypothetical protein Q8N83_08335 [Ignavibacteria bacterium]|nr:hypothetical protein [Ignavibacteria bacterium]